MKKEIIKFLQQSNYIEKEYSDEALEDAKEAWVYAVSKDIESIDINYILEIHKLLLQRLRPDIAGKFRTCDVWIGGSPKKVVSQSVFKSELYPHIAPEAGLEPANTWFKAK